MDKGGQGINYQVFVISGRMLICRGLILRSGFQRDLRIERQNPCSMPLIPSETTTWFGWVVNAKAKGKPEKMVGDWQ